MNRTVIRSATLVLVLSVGLGVYAQSAPATRTTAQTTSTAGTAETPGRAVFSSGSGQTEDSTSALVVQDLEGNARALLAYTTVDYPVTPGDVYSLVFLRGATSDSVAVVVGNDYAVNMGVFGTVSARGQTFDQFRRTVERLVSVAYPGSMPQLLIQSTGVFKVLRLGETSTTVEFSAWGLTRLSALYVVSRTPYTSLRSVEVRSTGGATKSYDLFKAQRDGDLTQDPYLKPGDTVILKELQRSVTVTGRVRRPGIYQLLPGETLSTLVETYAQGFAERADLDRLVVLRIVEATVPSGQQFYMAYEANKEFNLINRDTVTIAGLEDLLPVVWFDGALGVDASGGSLESSAHIARTFTPGERLSTAIQKVRAMVGPASSLEEAYISRGGQKIPVDLSAYLYDKDFKNDHVLETNDVIVIPFRQLFVTVSGAVHVPGRYPYIPDRSWAYYVALAGGFDKDKNARDAIDILDRQGVSQGKNRIIQPEDMITARYNSSLYTFGRISTILTTVLSVASIVISVLSVTN